MPPKTPPTAPPSLLAVPPGTTDRGPETPPIFTVWRVAVAVTPTDWSGVPKVGSTLTRAPLPTHAAALFVTEARSTAPGAANRPGSPAFLSPAWEEAWA